MARMEKVSSSSVDSVGYERRARRLLVRYRDSGNTYAYSGVEPVVFEALREASSIGRFVNARIKGRYPFQRIVS